jgi:hypothetical protein|tara:strand:- start:2784 stop:2993 length:210 start_codon:yes stop_codon:yes gene_type:complete
MAKIMYTSFHTGGQLAEMEANTPAEIAQSNSLPLEGVSIFVNDTEAVPSAVLRDGDLVSFQKKSTKSGD